MNYEYEDLFQTGFIGLMKATKKYTKEKGKFSNYACWLIWGEIKIMSRDDKYIPNPRRNRIHFNMDSLNREIPGIEKIVEVIELIPDSENIYNDLETKIMLNKALSKIDEKGREIIRQYFLEDKSQKEIAEHFNTTQVNISRIMKKNFKTMKKYCEI
jgi:RNA polymerase sigma factor (sigma-70 family)